MKYLFKYLVKLIFVAVIPFGMTVVLVNLFYYSPWSPVLIAVFAILTALTFLNAVFYAIQMKRTYLLPKIKCQWNTGFGIYIRKVQFHWELDLPLLTLIFQRRK